MVFESHLFLLENTAPMVDVSNIEPEIVAGNLQTHQKAGSLWQCYEQQEKEGAEWYFN